MKNLLLVAALITLLPSCGKKKDGDTEKDKIKRQQAIYMMCGDISIDNACVDADYSETKRLLPIRWFYSPYCYQKYVRCVKRGL